MKFANATNLHRKSGVAQWRDLLFPFPVLTQKQALQTQGDRSILPAERSTHTF